jgi:hypothetical protein
MRLEDAVTDVLTRLADEENKIWSRDEIALYFKDGLDQFCRRSKCLWDIYVIENLPPIGNWQTDLEKYLAEQKPGFGLTDERMGFTAEDERGKPASGDTGAYATTRGGPVVASGPGDRQFFDDHTNLTVSAGKQVTGGTLPNNTVEVARVAYDNRTLTGISSQRMRELDPRYETRGGEPQWFMFDKDGLFYLRVVPAAQGSATYDTVDGSWGTCTYRSTGEGTETLEAVEWENLNSATADGGTLTLTGQPGNTLGNANSTQWIPTQNGYVEWTTGTGVETTYCGLSNVPFTDKALNFDSIKYAVKVSSVGNVQAAEDGVAKGSSTPYTDGDKVRIQVTNGTVEYKLNGTTFYTSVKTSNFPLAIHADSTFGGSGSLINTVVSYYGSVKDTIVENGYDGYGILRTRSDCFPTGGPHGTPTRIHPDSLNIKVEVFRLNRNLDSHEVEIPVAYQKYPVFWAMYKALERTGPGQDIELSDHFKQRFETGTGRMEAKVREMDKERKGRFGGLVKMTPFGLGDPVPPYPYGVPF